MNKISIKKMNRLMFALFSVGLFFLALAFFDKFYLLLNAYTYKLKINLESKLVFISCVNFILSIFLIIYALSIVLRVALKEKVKWFVEISFLLFFITLITFTLKYFNRDFLLNKSFILDLKYGLTFKEHNAYRIVYYSSDIIITSFITGVSIGVSFFYWQVIKKIKKTDLIAVNFSEIKSKNIRKQNMLAIDETKKSFIKSNEKTFTDSIFSFLNLFFCWKYFVMSFKRKRI
jgi:hypothetical protein